MAKKPKKKPIYQYIRLARNQQKSGNDVTKELADTVPHVAPGVLVNMVA